MTDPYDREQEARNYVNRYVGAGWQNHLTDLMALLARAEAHGFRIAEQWFAEAKRQAAREIGGR